jgi:tripartite ATP-independent transporter DctP family solute receptor
LRRSASRSSRRSLDLPWLFKDEATYASATKGPVGEWPFQKLEAKGITGLAYWDNGFHMASANRPLLMPADFQGLKIRISGSKIADRYFRDLGSIPQIMAFSEVYQALQTGVVDGCENTVSNYLTQKFHEVQKDITVSYHAHLQYAVIVNSKFWNGLPADIRAQLEKAMDEATDYTNSIVVKENEDALGFLALVNILLLPAGNFMEPTSIILIMAPILAPAAKRLGIDLVHFGIVIDVNMEVGLCHPPVSLNLCVASMIAGMRITDLAMAVFAVARHHAGVPHDRDLLAPAHALAADGARHALRFAPGRERSSPSLRSRRGKLAGGLPQRRAPEAAYVAYPRNTGIT